MLWGNFSRGPSASLHPILSRSTARFRCPEQRTGGRAPFRIEFATGREVVQALLRVRVHPSKGTGP